MKDIGGMTYKSYYTILGTDICLDTPSQEINEFCDYIWQNFISAERNDASEHVRAYPSSQKEKCYSVFIEDTVAVCFGKEMTAVPERVVSKALENVINGQAVNKIDKKNMLTLHSGIVSKNEGAILILGDSGHGKSTFTLELVAQHGWRYLTDEVGLLDMQHIAHPFLKTVSFTPDIVKLDNRWTSKKYGIDSQTAVPPEKHGISVPLKAILIIKYAPENKLKVEPLGKSEALVRLFQAQVGRATSVASVEQIAEIIKKVPAYRLQHNNASEAAHAAYEILSQQR